MELPSAQTLLNVAVVVVLIAVGWTVLRFVLKQTARLFRIGCLALIVVGAVVLVARLYT